MQFWNALRHGLFQCSFTLASFFNRLIHVVDQHKLSRCCFFTRLGFTPFLKHAAHLLYNFLLGFIQFLFFVMLFLPILNCLGPFRIDETFTLQIVYCLVFLRGFRSFYFRRWKQHFRAFLYLIHTHQTVEMPSLDARRQMWFRLAERFCQSFRLVVRTKTVHWRYVDFVTFIRPNCNIRFMHFLVKWCLECFV